MSGSRSVSAGKGSRSASPRPTDSREISVKMEVDVKEEEDVGEAPGSSKAESVDPKLEPSDTKRELDSPMPTTPPVPPPRPKPAGPQLIDDLPVATEAALATFTELPNNHYQYNTLGRSREAMEGMTCDCEYVHGEDESWVACGHGSDCINRLTQVECVVGECRCRKYCQNQRFQRKQYAPIEIVQTEKKGFGLRAKENIYKDQFIYEYVGDVVSHPSFMKRMRDYASEGLKHFYFMMLQKDEYIDATKRGGIGRFANHSCSPNCYVAKWTVDKHVRMGIFAHRSIKKHEELTFNYNVDRYGHDAQPCYCGEPNCVGVLGGKTQTDLGGMDDLYLDALGITDEVEKLGLKGSKKKKGKKLDEDYIPDLKPLVEKDAPKVIQAMRQTQSRKVLFKLLTRIKITEDSGPLRQLMRLRCFSVMANIFEDYVDDAELVLLALECMRSWPLINRNKVDDSKVNVPVEALTKSEDEKLRTVAQELVDKWAGMIYAYRIPKRVGGNSRSDAPVDGVDTPDSAPEDVVQTNSPTEVFFDESERKFKRARVEDLEPEEPVLSIKPLGFTSAPRFDAPRPVVALPIVPQVDYYGQRMKAKKDVADIIKEATARADAARAEAQMAEWTARQEQEAKEKKEQERKERKAHPKPSAEEREALKEKRLQKLISPIVVQCLSKHREQLDGELFKKHAKELTQLIADKEKKSSSYKENKLDAISDEKKAKIKKFAKEYIAKVLRKLKQRSSHDRAHGRGKGAHAKGLPPPTDSANTSVAGASGSTPDSRAGVDVDISGEPDVDDIGEDAMDIDDDDGEPDDAGDSPVSQDSKPGVPSIADPRLRVRAGEQSLCGDSAATALPGGPQITVS